MSGCFCVGPPGNCPCLRKSIGHDVKMPENQVLKLPITCCRCSLVLDPSNGRAYFKEGHYFCAMCWNSRWPS